MKEVFKKIIKRKILFDGEHYGKEFSGEIIITLNYEDYIKFKFPEFVVTTIDGKHDLSVKEDDKDNIALFHKIEARYDDEIIYQRTKIKNKSELLLQIDKAHVKLYEHLDMLIDDLFIETELSDILDDYGFEKEQL